MTFETKEYSVRLRRQEEIIAKDIKCPGGNAFVPEVLGDTKIGEVLCDTKTGWAGKYQTRDCKRKAIEVTDSMTVNRQETRHLSPSLRLK